VTGSFNHTATGWVAGGGVEWAPWNNNWIVRAEGLYYSFDGVSAFGTQQGTLRAIDHQLDLGQKRDRRGPRRPQLQVRRTGDRKVLIPTRQRPDN